MRTITNRQQRTRNKQCRSLFHTETWNDNEWATRTTTTTTTKTGAFATAKPRIDRGARRATLNANFTLIHCNCVWIYLSRSLTRKTTFNFLIRWINTRARAHGHYFQLHMLHAAAAAAKRLVKGNNRPYIRNKCVAAIQQRIDAFIYIMTRQINIHF